MEKEFFTLGIDIGSTFMKAAVFSSQREELLWTASLPAVERRPGTGRLHFEIDADKIFETIRSLISQALKHYPCNALLFSTQMHGFVYHTDSRKDTYISWQDARCLEQMPGKSYSYLEYLQKLIPEETLRDCGVPLKPSLGLCNLFTLLAEDTSCPRSGELFTLGSWLNHKLGGTNTCHITNAAPLGLANVRTRNWNRELIGLLGFDDIRLPVIAASDFEICGEGRLDGNSFLLYPDYGDQQVSVLGAMPGRKNAIINIATASQISLISSSFVPGNYESRPYFENRYLNTISNMPGGRNFAVLTNFLKECALVLCGRKLSTEDIWNALQDVYCPEGKGLEADILFYPTEHKADGGALKGILPDNLSVNGLFTAAYKNTADILEQALKKLAGQNVLPDQITFLGGVSWKNPALIKEIAVHLHMKYTKSVIPDEAFNGLYRLSLRVCGEISNLEDDRERHLHTEKGVNI